MRKVEKVAQFLLLKLLKTASRYGAKRIKKESQLVTLTATIMYAILKGFNMYTVTYIFILTYISKYVVGLVFLYLSLSLKDVERKKEMLYFTATISDNEGLLEDN